MIRALAIISLLTFFCACKTSPSDTLIKSESAAKENDVEKINLENKHYVMVIDDGFDTTHPVFNNKIAAAFSLQCGEDAMPDDLEKLLDYESFKGYMFDLIKEQAKPDFCKVIPLSPMKYEPGLKEIEQYRDLWNTRHAQFNLFGLLNEMGVDIYNKVLLTAEGKDLIDQTQKFNYHGTSVASVIAEQNPNVKLVVRV